MDKIIKMIKNLALVTLLAFVSFCTDAQDNSSSSSNSYDYAQLSSELMQGVMDKADVSDIREKLANASVDDLAEQLDTDLKKKAFWINIYNAHIQIILQKDPSLYDDRGKFFGTPMVDIAGETMSFDRIEHGIIRGSRSKITLGYFKKVFVPSFERKLRCDKRDGRIHFALNCGAKSCPKVAVYYADKMDAQLTAISKQFLNTVTEVEGETVKTTPLFSWFRGDFGGKCGVKDFLKEMGIVDKDLDIKLEFKSYDWTIDLENYTEI